MGPETRAFEARRFFSPVLGPARTLWFRLGRGWNARGIVRDALGAGRGWGAALKTAFGILRRQGLPGLAASWARRPGRATYDPELRRLHYTLWAAAYDSPGARDNKALADRARDWPEKPLLSLVLRLQGGGVPGLEATLASVSRQAYPCWELCIAGGAGLDEAARTLALDWAAGDSRVRAVFLPDGDDGSELSNAALGLAQGAWILPLEPGDLLAEQALFWVADAALKRPDAGVIYGDHDRLGEDGGRREPDFKCDWNLYLARSRAMADGLWAWRARLVGRLGGFRAGFQGCHDFDLTLRCAETLAAGAIVHIPRVLCHVRPLPSRALPGAALAVDGHLARGGVKGRAEALDSGLCRVHYELPAAAPLVSLVIPTRNAHRMVRRCVEGIFEKTEYGRYEIVLVDNGSDEAESLAYFRALEGDPRVRVLRDGRPFNYSALNNAAVAAARGDYVALLNNDLELISPGWLGEMLALAAQPGAGAVGARLWYPDGGLQHGGVILGPSVAEHSHKRMPRDAQGRFPRTCLVQELSAVSGACLLVKKSLYEAVGGLDERNLGVAYNDVDFCLRLRAAGYTNLWTPHAEFFHHESASRRGDTTLKKKMRFFAERECMLARWGGALAADPAYNPNLTFFLGDFSQAWPPRVALHGDGATWPKK